ncbi:MAG: hypothetical protein ABI425_02060 [Patescibacteria group bacterium]
MTEDKQTSGNFFSGLMFGAIAGAASYFFLKTEEGKKARQKLAEEWEKAKEEMAKSGAIEDATKSLPETVQHTIEHIIEPKRLVKTTTIKRAPVKRMEAPKKKETKKFKGV